MARPPIALPLGDSAMNKLFIQSHGAASALVVATVIGSVVAEWVVTARERVATTLPVDAGVGARVRVSLDTLVEASTARTRGNSAADRGTKRVIVVSLVVALAVAYLLARRGVGPALPGNGWTLVVVGVAMMWAGVGLRVWAIAVLGRFFRRVVIVQEGQRVIRDGPYRLIRHPAYAGNLLVAAGFGVVLGYALGLAVMIVIPVLGHLPRIRVEEAELERGLGDDYRRYEQETWRLVPRVW
jgi:protein-S-isoprenylcysteine O-methyltransferase Ste14